MVRSSCCTCGWMATAAIIGTMCRKRITSPTNGFGASCRKIDLDVSPHDLRSQPHPQTPSPISAQNSRAFGEAVLRIDQKCDSRCTAGAMFCRMSPNAVSANPRGARTDSKTCTHTTAHTIDHPLPAVLERRIPHVSNCICVMRHSRCYRGNAIRRTKAECGLLKGRAKTLHKAVNILK